MLQTNYGIVDFHSHILPGIDDGADSMESSLKMLALSKEQGVDTIVSTSHYYNFHESIDSFVRRRDDAIYNLGRFINEHDMDLPEIISAAEVRVFPDMHSAEGLERLCIDGTKNILLEMPYASWTAWMYNEVYALITMGFTPIMAHVERYLGPVSEREILTKLLSMNVHVQCNADSFLERKTRGFIKKLIKLNRLSAIGSDFHNLEIRSSHFDEAIAYLTKKYGEEYVEQLMKNAAAFL